MREQFKDKPVCILGCGRSGTSIFGELFQSLPNYRYYSEPEWIEFAAINFDTPVAIKVPKPPEHSTTTPGLPFKLRDFLKIFPEHGVIFWQVRHPLDAICSLRVGIAKNWGHHPRPPDYKEWAPRSLVERCAHHWNYLNTVGYQQMKDLVQVNRFEDMIKEPLRMALEKTIQAGVENARSIPEIEHWALRVQDKNNQKFQEADCSKPYSRNDHIRKVGRWKENLTEQQISQILPIVRKGAEIFGYNLSNL